MSTKVGRDLGIHPKLPKKTIPHSGMKSDGTLDFAFVLEENEKLDDDFKKIKNLVYYYEWIGRQQVVRNIDKIRKNLHLSYGVIDTDDYIPGESEQGLELEMIDGEKLDYDLKFFPIIPTIVNSLVSELGKHYIHTEARAINSEATNEVLEERNQILRQLIINPLESMFQQRMESEGIEQGTDLYEQQRKIFESLPKIQKYMNSEFRLELEKWANNQLQIDEKRFNMKEIEKSLFFNKLATDRPFLHINLMDDDYKPEVLDMRYCYYLKSPYLDDVSDSIMFGWFEYESPVNIITRFGHKLREEDIEKLEKLHLHLRSMLTIETGGQYQIDTPGLIESAQNYLSFRELFGAPNFDVKHRYEEYQERLIQISHLYFQVPRKFGKVTVKSGESVYSKIVDEYYTPTYQPVYDTSVVKEKTEENLLFGEHIEWFYKNELWRSLKINLSTNPNPDYSDDIYVILEKFPVQFPTNNNTFGSGIPVFGGPRTNRYNESTSIVEKCKPWQVLYNYTANRGEQMLKTEIGKFFAMNQNVIPKEVMGEDWGPNNISRFIQVARDLGIVGTDNSITNTGTTTTGLTGGYGQIVDLSITDDVIKKFNLAQIFKNECLMQVGITPQFLGDMSPDETATGISQGISRSFGNVKYLYEEHFSLLEKAKSVMLEFAKYFAIKEESVEQVFVNGESERVIFRMPTMDLPLSKFGIYITSDIDDSLVLEKIRNWAISDNTIEASLLDKVSIINAKSVSEIYSKIKDLQKQKELREDAIREQEQQQQQAIIESQERQIKEKLQFEAAEREKDRQSNERIAEIKVIGQSQFSEGNGFEELMKLEEQHAKQRNYYAELLNSSVERSMNTQQMNQDHSLKNKEILSNENIEREKLQLEREKIQAGLKKSMNDVKIAKINK